MWSVPPGGLVQTDRLGTNDSPVQEKTVNKQCSPEWLSWEDVPKDVRQVAANGPWFVEVFSGTARLTKLLREAGIPCLPPMDVTLSEMVPSAFDVVNVERWEFFMQLVMLGAIFFAHFGTPCNTFTSARKDDGGPPPLRSSEFPLGLLQLSEEDGCLTFLGNLFLFRTCEACSAISLLGGDFSIENPLFSLLWSTPPMMDLCRECRVFPIDFDQCVFGAPSKKPTRLAVTHSSFLPVQQWCQGGHPHVRLKGKVWSEFFQRWVFRTKLAQEYPWKLCQAMADAIGQLWSSPLAHLQPSFDLQGDVAHRKRPVGSSKPWKTHRQERSALMAQAAGYQLKRGARKPLLMVESTPGEAIEWVMTIPHPFSEDVELDEFLVRNISRVTGHSSSVVSQRYQLMEHWQRVAEDALQRSDWKLRQVPDPALRKLLRGVPDGTPARLGTTCNVELYRMFLQEVNSLDQDLPDFLLQGFPIVGPIARSHRWAPFDKPQAQVPLEELSSKAWVMRKKIINRVRGVQISENLKKIWEATIEDVKECSCIGPIESEEEVDALLGRDDWIPTQRFEVVQKNKVRGCDSATTNLINPATVITEKLQLPSTDSNVAALRKLRSEAPWSSLAGWVLDERKAYRQVGILPEHRRFSVICLKNPESARPCFFVMVGHSFGLVSAVYNYNRRSAAINEILVSLFGLVAFSFYDDKYGFEPVETVESAHRVAQAVHFWLGAQFDQKKLQLSRSPVILGVTYDLSSMTLQIKDDRRRDLIEEMDQILASGLLDPGSAGKLKGKLMFGASQLWGKVGRAFLRSISERQYARSPVDELFKLDEALEISLKHWRKLIESGPPRPIELKRDRFSDVVIFTDGFTPDPRDCKQLPDRVGGVLFDRRLNRPRQFTAVVSKSVQKKWLVRKTQIVPVEMIATILALTTFSDRLRNTDLVMLIDSEAVEAALVKGYSSKEDLCLLISTFWDSVFHLKTRVFIDRVSTDANPADWPSRNDLATGSKAGWVTVETVWPSELLE